MTTEEKYRRILGNHLPPEAVAPIYDYLNRHRVHFHITRQRSSKLGDYRWPQKDHDYHEISINGDLNAYLFLWVFLHEAAHLETHLKHGGTLINVNIVDAEKIRAAHKDPEAYPDLVVRVTGFTAYFMTLTPEFRQLVVDRLMES